LFRKNSLALLLAEPGVVACGVERDNAEESSTGPRVLTTSRGKRKHEEATAALDSLVDSLASMADSTSTHKGCAEMVSLFRTLKNLREWHATPNLMKVVEKQLEDVVLRRTPGSLSVGHDAPGVSNQYSSPEDN